MSSAKSGKVSEEERRKREYACGIVNEELWSRRDYITRKEREKEKICVGENKGSSSPGRCHLTAALNTVKQWLG